MCDGIFWRFHFIIKQSVTILWYDVGKYNDENFKCFLLSFNLKI